MVVILLRITHAFVLTILVLNRKGITGKGSKNTNRKFLANRDIAETILELRVTFFISAFANYNCVI